jgi:isopentenyl-diphosphate delta-isomerase
MRKKDNAYVMNVQLLPEIKATIRTMNSTQDEILVEVDKDNNEIGTIEKRTAHNTNKRYHRAAHIMIFNSQGQVVLQQRSLNKTSQPGKRDMP